MPIELLSSNNGQILVGPVLIEPTVYADERGFFYESWNEQTFLSDLRKAGANSQHIEAISFNQDNHSRSSHGVLRGLHYQLPASPQAKLVRCTFGIVFDVVVDLRRSSDTYGQWSGVYLSSDNFLQLWVPVGFAHGFLTISDFAEVQYKTCGYWSRDNERSLLWNDSDISIDWPLKKLNIDIPILGSKDFNAPSLLALEAKGDVF